MYLDVRRCTAIRSRARLWLRDAIVLASFVPPVLFLLKLIYRMATWWVVRRLRALPFVRSVLLSGSVAVDDCVYGASDLDFIVLVEGSQDRLLVKRVLRASFRRWRRWFPIIGPVEERVHNVFFLDEFDRDRYAAIVKCRMKTGRARSLYGEPHPCLRAALTPDEVLAEVVLQLKSVAGRQVGPRPNLYFWKSKIRALLPLLGPDETWQDVAPMLDPPSAAFLRRIFTSSNRLLFLRRSDDDANELGWDIVSRLCGRVAEVHGLDRLPCVSIPFRSTPAPQCAPEDMPALPAGVVPRAMAGDADAFGGPAVLNTASHPSLLLEVRGGAFGHLASGLRVGRAYSRSTHGHALVWWEDYVFHVAGGVCVAVLSRWDSPHLFPDNFVAPGLLRYPRRFLELLLLERDNDLDYLKRFYSRLIEPESTAVDSHHRHEESLRYFETRDRIVDGFASIHLLLALSEDGLVNFGTVEQIFDDARAPFPEHREMLQLLSAYADAIARKKVHSDANALPAGLLRAGIHFFGERLYGRGVRPGEPRPRHLTLSLVSAPATAQTS